MLMTGTTAPYLPGPNIDYTNGGAGNDELYAQDGTDVLKLDQETTSSICGAGFDTVVGFNPNRRRHHSTAQLYEDVRTQL